MNLKKIWIAGFVWVSFSFAWSSFADVSGVQKKTYGFEKAEAKFLNQLGRDLEAPPRSFQFELFSHDKPTVAPTSGFPKDRSSLVKVHLFDDRDLERVLLPRFLRQSGVLSQPLPTVTIPPMPAGDYQVVIQIQSGTISAPLPDCSLMAGELDLPLLCPNRVETQWQKDNWVMLGLTLPSAEVRTRLKLTAKSDKWYLPNYENEFDLNVFGLKLITQVLWATQGTSIEALKREVPVSEVGRVEIKDLGLLRTIYNLVLRGKLCGTKRCPEVEVWVKELAEARLAQWIQSEEFADMIKKTSSDSIRPAIEKVLRFEEIGLAGSIRSLFFKTEAHLSQANQFFGVFGSDLNWTLLKSGGCTDFSQWTDVPSKSISDFSRSPAEPAQMWLGQSNDPSRMADFMLGRKLLQEGLEAATQVGSLCGNYSFDYAKLRGEIAFRPTAYPVWKFEQGPALSGPMEVDFSLANRKEKKWFSLKGVRLNLEVAFDIVVDSHEGTPTLFLKIKKVSLRNLKFPKGFKGTLAKLLFKGRISREVNQYLTSDKIKIPFMPKSFEIFSSKTEGTSELEMISLGWLPEHGITVGLKANHK